MTNMLQRGSAVATCALMFGWSAPLVSGSGANAPDPPSPTGEPPTNSTSYRPDPSEFSLTVSPTRLVVGPADIRSEPEILVVNRGHTEVEVTVQKRDFTGGTDGSLVFLKHAPYSASSWVTVSPTTFRVAPGAAQAVTASIAVPTEPEPGDHQVALVFLVPAGQTGANIRINRGVATPLYITVPGPADDSSSITDLAAARFVLGGGSVALTAKVHNNGTVHRDFRNKARLTVDAAGTPSAFPDFTIVRGSTRDIGTTWDPPLLCVCHPTVSFRNADGSVQTATVLVIVFPLYLLGILVGALLVLFVGLRVWRRRYRANVARAAAKLRPRVGDAHA
jgi:hypothetical protein